MDRKLVYSIAISAVVAAIFIVMAYAGIFHAAATGFSDSLYAGGKTIDDIVILSIDDNSLQQIGRWPWQRDVWVGVLQKLNGSSAIGIDVSFFEPSPAEKDSAMQAALSSAQNVIMAAEYANFSGVKGTSLLKPVFDADSGFVNVFQGTDGVVREIPTHIEGIGIENKDAFSLKIAEKWLGAKTDVPERMLVNFFGTFKKVSIADVLNGTQNFTGKIVLIGATANDLHDYYLTPVGNMAGVDVHANAIQTIITRKFLHYQDMTNLAAAIILLCLVAGLATAMLKMRYATPIIVGLMVAYFLASSAAFDGGTVMNMLYPFGAILMCHFAIIGFRYVSEEKQRRWITKVFGMYVSKEIVNELLKNPAGIKLGGRKKNVTILFSDIRGFTAISEKVSPEELVQLLNGYLTNMTGIIMNARGVVDKYIGDAIMAFWGAPLDEPSHARLACESALDMMKQLEGLKSDWKKMGLELNIGIGINTGDVVVGNMGSDQRFDFTVIGDPVNLSSRLEGLNKAYSTSIIISEYTLEQVKGFFTRELDAVQVKGKKKPVRIFQLMAKSGEETEQQKNIKQHFESGLALYRQQKFKHASEEFKKSAELGDAPSSVFITRCAQLENEHLPKDWDGVFIAQTK